jgi:hypothetical protein
VPANGNVVPEDVSASGASNADEEDIRWPRERLSGPALRKDFAFLERTDHVRPDPGQRMRRAAPCSSEL